MLQIGNRLSGRYRIDGVLGQGGMGAVYLGSLESLGKKVAIKEMEIPFSNEETLEQGVKQFKREATFLAHLDHPNLVKVTDFFTESSKHYLVMEYVNGETLQARLERLQQPLSWEELKPWAKSLAEVLHYLHSQEPAILFRDLKPANIMIESSGRLKLIDFGIARTAQPGTETSTFLKGTGTNGFSPIEQYGMGETTDQRSDIYSYGATLYYLLTGKVPPEAISRVSSGKELIKASSLNPSLASAMDAFLERCLAVKQDERYQSMAQIGRVLDSLDSELTQELAQTMAVASIPSAPAITIEMYPSSGPKKSTNIHWAAATAILGVAITVMTAIFVHHVRGLRESQVVETPLAVVEPVTTIRYRNPLPNSRPSQARPSPNVDLPEGVVLVSPEEFQERMRQRKERQAQQARAQKSQVASQPTKAKKKPRKTRKAPSLGDGPSYPQASKNKSKESDEAESLGRVTQLPRGSELRAGPLRRSDFQRVKTSKFPPRRGNRKPRSW